MAKTGKTNKIANDTPKSQIIKVNPYENPERVMELMAKICSAQASADTDLYWKPLQDAYKKEINGKSLGDYLEENRKSLWNTDFYQNLNEYCKRLSWSLEDKHGTEYTQIVVAGGFSSGKSSFLNKLTKSRNLLPTGTEPVSVVKTYLYCSSKSKNVEVKGVNQKRVLVTLDTGVLQAIQHSSESNIYLASVLEKLFVEIPSNELDGLSFIDTPGYNNSNKANEYNGKTDDDVAMEAFDEGDVLFWMIDCENGTAVADDIEHIRHFDGPKVIIFNKADKKGINKSKEIVEEALINLCNSGIDDIIDVMAYSTVDEKIYYSHNKYVSLSKLIEKVRTIGRGMSEENQLKQSIIDLFDDEIASSKATIEDRQKERIKEIEERGKYYKHYQKDKEANKGFLDWVKNIMVTSYSDVLHGAQKYSECALNALNTWLDCINEIDGWDYNRIKITSDLHDILDKYGRKLNSQSDKYNAINYKYYDEDVRNEKFEVIEDELHKLNDEYKRWYDNASAQCADTQKQIDAENEIIQKMTDYKNMFVAALEDGIRQYKQRSNATIIESEKKQVSVFDAIKNDDYKAFLCSFENGIDMAVCNADGYTPLTYAVQFGNNAMVEFMLKHGAKPESKDRRGYNAFHTAVENQYKDICKILLEEDPDLISTTTSSGETVQQLADKHTFSKWIKNEISNAF